MTRKIIQIVHAEEKTVLALADDGTAWYRCTHSTRYM